MSQYHDHDDGVGDCECERRNEGTGVVGIFAALECEGRRSDLVMNYPSILAMVSLDNRGCDRCGYLQDTL
jgi:hypothetical protein